jgi:hypothetical protein
MYISLTIRRQLFYIHYYISSNYYTSTSPEVSVEAPQETARTFNETVLKGEA